VEWLESVVERAPDHDVAVQQLLHAVRTHLGMQVAWTSEFVGDEQVFRFVDADAGATAPAVGSRAPLAGSYCARVLDGRLPELIPDSRHEPSTALLDITQELQIGSYLGVPLVGVDGTVEGMLCAVSSRTAPALSERDLATLRLLAQLLHDLQARALDEADLRSARERRGHELDAVIRGGGRWVALQPVLDTSTGRVTMLEGLSRFASERTPAEWFDAAARAGRSVDLELAAAASVLQHLAGGAVAEGAAVAVNVSPATVVEADLARLLGGVDPSRVVLEVTEHQPVADYDALAAALDPWRARGLRLAVDDAGAGFASLRHVLVCRPDIVKLDMALVRGVDADPVRRSLIEAVRAFTAEQGMTLVAEGVETEAERDALVGMGLSHLQGFLIGHPQDVRG
jgi:EAL domain-containing protein (putative c-di-GMP-specific phosphodiesterase class I)